MKKEITEAMERMIKGRVGLLAKEPFFGNLALAKLELVEDPKCKTSWCDGRRLGYNPERVLAADSVAELESIWAHHVATCALGHPFRRGSRDAKRWNDASDHVVNGYITKAGFTLPEGSVYDPRFDGQYVEQVYATLAQEQQEQDEQDEASGDNTDPSELENVGVRGVPSNAGKGQGQGDPEPNPTGEVRDATSDEDDGEASPAEKADQEAEWQTATAQAEQAARGAGHLAGATERLAKSALQPLVSWKEALQRLLRAKAKDDFSYRRPNRRFIPLGFVAPSLISERCGKLGFAIDYSASITQTNVDQFCSEVEEARQALNPESVEVVIFDHGIRQVLSFASGEPIELPPVRSGGGTSFVAPVEHFNASDVQPEVLVFLTDLDCSSFAPEPSFPVVWVSTRKGSAPYGDVILMFD